MKNARIMVVVLGMLALAQVCAAGEPPAKLLWSVVLGTNTVGRSYGVRQIVADGSGGCVLSHTMTEAAVTTYYVRRYDKKAKLLWQVAFTSLSSIDVVYCDKKYVVVCYEPAGGDKRIMTFDLKNNQTTTATAGVDYYNNMNNDGEYGGPGDKSGFFAIRFVVASGEYTLERRSYKPAAD